MPKPLTRKEECRIAHEGAISSMRLAMRAEGIPGARIEQITRLAERIHRLSPSVIGSSATSDEPPAYLVG